MIPLSPKSWLAIGGGVSLLAIATWVWRIDSLRAEHLAALTQCQSEKSEQAELFQRAQKTALDLANAAKARKEAKNEAARQQADARYDDLGSKYRALILRKATADRGATSRTRLPGTGETAQGTVGPGEGAGVPVGRFVIMEADALICGENTARLEAAREWAIRAGNTTPSSEGGFHQ